MTKMKGLAVPNLNQDIEEAVHKCIGCQETASHVIFGITGPVKRRMLM